MRTVLWLLVIAATAPASGAVARGSAGNPATVHAGPRLVGDRLAFVSEPWRARFSYRGGRPPLRLVASQGPRRVDAQLRRSGATWTAKLRLRSQGRWHLSLRSRGSAGSLGAITAGYHVRAPVKIEAAAAGTLLVADARVERVLRLDPRTGVALSVSSRLPRLASVASAADGTLFVLADEKLWRLERGRPRLVAAFASEGPTDLAPRSDGSVYVARYGTTVDLVSPAGAIETAASGFDRPHGITLASDGSLLVADSYADAVRRIGAGGKVTTLATGLARPTDVVVASGGTLLVAEHDAGRISRLGVDGSTSTVTDRLTGPSGLALTADGSLYAADVDGGAVFAVDAQSGAIRRVSR